MKKLLILMSFLCSFVSVCAQYVSDEVQVLTANPIVWDSRAQAADFLSLFPVGSKVVDAADVALYATQNRNLPTGKYYATTFLVKLPSSTALVVVSDSSRFIEESNHLPRIHRFHIPILILRLVNII